MTAAAAMQREAVGLVLVAVLPLRLLRRLCLRRAAGNEGRQRIDIARLGLLRARLGLLRARLMTEVLLTVALLARLIGLRVALDEGLRVRRNEGLRLARAEGLIGGERLAVILAFFELLVTALLDMLVVSAAAFRPRRLEVRILLAELLVRRRDQPEIMFGVLEIVFGRNRVA